MSDFDPTVQDVMNNILRQIAQELPEVDEVLTKAREKKIPPEQTMAELMGLMQNNSQLQNKLMTICHQKMTPLRSNPQEGLPEVMFRKPNKGQVSLNPLYEAALIERTQFDGDIPELRTGPLPEGVQASVSVLTDARNPIMIGQMLETASEQVTQKVIEHQKERKNSLEDQLDKTLAFLPESKAEIKEDGTLALTMNSPIAKQMVTSQVIDSVTWGDTETDLEIYKRGRVPSPVPVEALSGSALLQLSVEEKQKYTWKFISTTQGRNSAVSIIGQDIREILIRLGWDITIREPVKNNTAIAEYSWMFNIDGPKATATSFDIISVVSKSIARGLAGKIEAISKRPLFLEVRSVCDASERNMGWSASLTENSYV